MRWVSLMAGFAVILSALMVAGAAGFSATRPDRTPWPDAGFRACDLPCWSHVTPGQTAFGDAAPLLSQTLPADARLLISGSQVDFWAQAAGAPFYGYLYYARGKVDMMSMHVEIPVGQIVRRLGKPDCVYVEETGAGEHLMAVYWESKTGITGAVIPAFRNHWGPESRTETLLLSSAQRACDRTDAIPWHGFAPYPHYLRWSADLR